VQLDASGLVDNSPAPTPTVVVTVTQVPAPEPSTSPEPTTQEQTATATLAAVDGFRELFLYGAGIALFLLALLAFRSRRG